MSEYWGGAAGVLPWGMGSGGVVGCWGPSWLQGRQLQGLAAPRWLQGLAGGREVQLRLGPAWVLAVGRQVGSGLSWGASAPLPLGPASFPLPRGAHRWRMGNVVHRGCLLRSCRSLELRVGPSGSGVSSSADVLLFRCGTGRSSRGIGGSGVPCSLAQLVVSQVE